MSGTIKTSDNLEAREIPIDKKCLDFLDKLEAKVDEAKKDQDKMRAGIIKQEKEMKVWGPSLRNYYTQFLPKQNKRKHEI